MDSYDDKAIGRRLQIAREYAGHATATAAAEALGIKFPTYAGHENGSRGVVRAAPLYARRFRITLDWLLVGKGPGPGERAQDDADPSSQLRSALLAFGVDKDDLVQVTGIISTFVGAEKSAQSPSPADAQPASPRRAKAPSE